MKSCGPLQGDIVLILSMILLNRTIGPGKEKDVAHRHQTTLGYHIMGKKNNQGVEKNRDPRELFGRPVLKLLNGQSRGNKGWM